MTTEKELINRIGNIDVDALEAQTQERIKTADKMMSDVLDFEADLNEWEYDFLHSIIEWTSAPHPKLLTEKQYHILLKLYNKYC